MRFPKDNSIDTDNASKSRLVFKKKEVLMAIAVVLVLVNVSLDLNKTLPEAVRIASEMGPRDQFSLEARELEELMEEYMEPENKEKQLMGLQDHATIKSNHNLTGSWMGNWWIPPSEWHLFSADELRDIFQDRSVLFVGDSTARRASMSIYKVLNATQGQASAETAVHLIDSPSVIDVNKGRKTEYCTRFDSLNSSFAPSSICRDMPRNGNNTNKGSPRHFALLEGACTKNLHGWVQDELTDNSTLTKNAFDVVVIAYGVWHQVRPWDCRLPNRTTSDQVQELLEGLYQLQQKRPNLTIIWRTSGYDARRDQRDEIRMMNNQVMDYLDRIGSSRFMYVNWGGAIEPRSFDQYRIQGDMKPHYGLQPRLVLGQMLANVLQQQQKETSVRSSNKDGLPGLPHSFSK